MDSPYYSSLNETKGCSYVSTSFKIPEARPEDIFEGGEREGEIVVYNQN